VEETYARVAGRGPIVRRLGTRDADWIQELAERFIAAVKRARDQRAGYPESLR
jgi:hypothetical protein